MLNLELPGVSLFHLAVSLIGFFFLRRLSLRGGMFRLFYAASKRCCLKEQEQVFRKTGTADTTQRVEIFMKRQLELGQ